MEEVRCKELDLVAKGTTINDLGWGPRKSRKKIDGPSSGKMFLERLSRGKNKFISDFFIAPINMIND